jgi:hypothetical protein
MLLGIAKKLLVQEAALSKHSDLAASREQQAHLVHHGPVGFETDHRAGIRKDFQASGIARLR